MKKIYGHGDVIIKEIDELPQGVTAVEPTKGLAVLAYGEISGHAHCLDATKAHLFKLGDEMYMECIQDVDLKHQKLDRSQALDAHETVVLPRGTYSIGIVREFDYFTGEARKVAD